MPPLSPEQVTAALANMAQVSAQAAIDAQTVDFGNAPQPDLLILQWWKNLHIPAAQMKAMNACRMGTQANLAIYSTTRRSKLQKPCSCAYAKQ